MFLLFRIGIRLWIKKAHLRTTQRPLAIKKLLFDPSSYQDKPSWSLQTSGTTPNWSGLQMTTFASTASSAAIVVEEQETNPDVVSLRLWKSGNMRGYNELVERYERPLFHFIYRMMHDADESKDILQEVFVRLYQSLPRLREDKSLKSWLFQTANNLCIDYFRKHKPGRVTAMDHSDSLFEAVVESAEPNRPEGPDEWLNNRQLKDKVMKAIDELPKQQRMMMTLRSCKGLSLKEIAEVMDCNEKTVGTTLFAARKRLVDVLKPVLTEMYGPNAFQGI